MEHPLLVERDEAAIDVRSVNGRGVRLCGVGKGRKRRTPACGQEIRDARALHERPRQRETVSAIVRVLARDDRYQSIDGEPPPRGLVRSLRRRWSESIHRKAANDAR